MRLNGSGREAIVRLRGLSKSFEEGGRTRVVFDRADLDIEAGEFLALLGKSGSGKSTLLNLISGIDRPDSGQVLVAGSDLTALGEQARTVFRRDHIGIIFQSFNLIPTLTVLENITLPLDLRGETRRTNERAARELLERVGLAQRGDTFPDRLSGGEQQRVAIARALIHEPVLVLADEPTGNLDEETGRRVLSLLLELTRDSGKTLVMATHNPEIVPLADRICRIREGRLAVTLRRGEMAVEEF